MASAAATLAVAGAALRLANPCGISGVAKPVAQQVYAAQAGAQGTCASPIKFLLSAPSAFWNQN